MWSNAEMRASWQNTCARIWCSNPTNTKKRNFTSKVILRKRCWITCHYGRSDKETIPVALRPSTCASLTPGVTWYKLKCSVRKVLQHYKTEQATECEMFLPAVQNTKECVLLPFYYSFTMFQRVHSNTQCSNYGRAYWLLFINFLVVSHLPILW